LAAFPEPGKRCLRSILWIEVVRQMALLRIREAEALEGFRLRLTLTVGSVIERDVRALLVGPIFEAVRTERWFFQKVRAEGGTVVWPNGADLCPDVLIWGGAPPEESEQPIHPPR
jgi:hypothetical protein